MVRHLFRDYLLFEDQYEGAREFWERLVEDVARQMGQEGEWQPWMPRTFWNGTPISLDTAPIWDARSEKLKRAVRILQSPPESDDIEIAAWLTKLDYTESGGPGPTEELVINLALSEESSAIARTLLERWMDKGISFDEMQSLVRESLLLISD